MRCNINNMARLREVVLVICHLGNSWRQEVGCICFKHNLLKRDMPGYLMHLSSIRKSDKASQPNLGGWVVLQPLLSLFNAAVEAMVMHWPI